MSFKVADQALPGDVITFKDGSELVTDVVKTAGWESTPNGGKIWVYVTEENHAVPFDGVIKYERHTQKNREGKDIEIGGPPIKVNSPVLLTAIACIEIGDFQSLSVAQYLINRRLQELTELGLNHS